jgi:hypothetical protein
MKLRRGYETSVKGRTELAELVAQMMATFISGAGDARRSDRRLTADRRKSGSSSAW